MTHHVKGTLFVDYVRMIRRVKQADWSRLLEPEDIVLVVSRIEPDGWYPMESFERMGNAILETIANGDVQAARMWGRLSVDKLREGAPSLVSPFDPVETLMRFRVLRSTFFDFEALNVSTLVEDHAEIVIAYDMGPMAEEAASYQTMGFFERLLELAHATDVRARFKEKSWAGDRRTVLTLAWIPPSSR